MATHPLQQHVRADQFTQHETSGGLHLTDLDTSCPVSQFQKWYSAAQNYTNTSPSDPSGSQPSTKPIPHPESCTLSTASLPSGRVTARMVYLKEVLPPSFSSPSSSSPGSFIIYSNFGTSQKSHDLATNPWASLVFWWEPMERQVRVEGRASRLTREESQAYYASRVRGSRIGAWASLQSSVLKPRGDGAGVGEVEGEGKEVDDGRAQLDGWVRDTEARFKDQEDIPVPDYWGGLRIVPERVEFWQGRNNRLHDRFVYDRVEGTEGWKVERLSP